MKYIQFNLNRNNMFVSFLNDLGGNKFTFTLRWDEYSECFFMDIQDLEGKYIISGRALVNNLIIRNPNLPYIMMFAHTKGEIYEPTIDNIMEFGLFYDDGEVE